MARDLTEIPVILWVLLGTILLLQGSWMFYDAKKRNEYPWIWGIFGLLNTPGNLLIYLLVTRVIKKKKSCPHCGEMVEEKAIYCSHCGEGIDKGLNAEKEE